MLPFQTLADFQNVVSGCRVTRASGEEMTLQAGLEAGVHLLQDIDRKKKKVLLIGNGGSAAIASHLAIDLWKNGAIRAQAFNDASLLTCIGNDFGYPQIFSKPIERFADPGDVLVAISSSGKSANIVNGVNAARALQMKVITLSGFQKENPLSLIGDLNFYLASHSYGVVEVGHSLLLHALIDQVIAIKGFDEANDERRDEKSALSKNAPHSAC